MLALSSVALAEPPAQAESEPLRVALDPWPPYVDKSRPSLGVATDLVITALDRAGYATNVSFDKWARILEGTEIGVYDVIVAAWRTEEREKLFEFSEPYLFNEIKFIKRKGKPYTYEKLSDFKGLLIGTVDSYAYSPEFDETKLLIKVPSNHVIQNLLLLRQGRIDLTLDDQWAIRHEIAAYMPSAASEFEFLPQPLARRGLHLLVSRAHPKHKEIVAAFNKAVKEMKADGSFDKIVQKHVKDLAHLQDSPL